MKCIRKVQVRNDLGLHTRPATTIVQMLQRSKSEVWFKHKRVSINAKSILSLLILAAQKHARIQITCEGEDAEETADLLVAAFENKFGELG